MSSKNVPQKMQFLGTTQKLASLFPRLQNAKWRKTPTDSTVIDPKYVQIPMFLHIPRALEQWQICIQGFSRQISLGKKVLFSKIPPVQAKNFAFFLSWVSKTQPNHWTKRMANT